MLANIRKEAAVKYTTILPKACIDELKILADKKIVPSVSHGIRLAVENFVATQKQQEYMNFMQEAANDKSFIKRTKDTQNDFMHVDDEEEEW